MNLEQDDGVTERQQIQPGSRLSDSEVGKLSVNKEMNKLIKQLQLCMQRFSTTAGCSAALGI